MNQTFQKTEILKSKIIFSDLISKGSSAKKHPFVLVWKELEVKQAFPIRIAFSVSKKRFPLAVDRNAMKRKIREIYRLNKSTWYGRLNSNFAVLLIYTSKEKLKSSEMDSKLKQVFERFIEHVEPTN